MDERSSPASGAAGCADRSAEDCRVPDGMVPAPRLGDSVVSGGLPVPANELVPEDGPDRYRWFHRVYGWDLERDGRVTNQVEISPRRLLVVLRLGSTMVGSFGLDRRGAEQTARCLRSGTRLVVPVLHREASGCQLVVEPDPLGVVLFLLGRGAPGWRIRFTDTVGQLADLLEEGASLVYLRPPPV
ncbi:hypothetical protein G443_003618 [Actinoalloteichus cyanogriseus DSM 43889]|uniref:Uncharacterized protein n=1 Tax=Actinoalloteichus caeruleus DSM 43889 TaxID=1120930 RepID=A0ABT1JLG5_ACTCY|nr:hypothetical protein [Actinoalloteichus caeruleus DSM 43889]